MWKFWKIDRQTKISVQDIAKKQLNENQAVFESLKQYDEGKIFQPLTSENICEIYKLLYYE